MSSPRTASTHPASMPLLDRISRKRDEPADDVEAPQSDKTSGKVKKSKVHWKRTSPYARDGNKSVTTQSVASAAKEASMEADAPSSDADDEDDAIIDVRRDIFRSVQLSIASMRSARSDLIAAQSLQQETFESSVDNAELIDVMGKVLKAQIQLEGMLKHHIASDQAVFVAAHEMRDNGDWDDQSDSGSNGTAETAPASRLPAQYVGSDEDSESEGTLNGQNEADKENNKPKVKPVVKRETMSDDDGEVEVTVQTTNVETAATHV